MKITVIGTGYVGLVTGACFAEVGHEVQCIDTNQKKIFELKQGIVPFYEPGLDSLIERNTLDNRLKFSANYHDIDPECRTFFIAVPTPSLDNGACDLNYVNRAIHSLLEVVSSDITLVIKSTVPAGTIHTLEERFCDKKMGQKIHFVSNPEFLKEGSAVSDCMKPDRIILGSFSKDALLHLRQIYAPFTVNHDRIIEMDPTSSEMTKYASNAMLATRISFMNELSKTCEAVGANINSVRIGMGSDARIGYHFLYAGIGWGGSCFPKDIRALIQLSKQNGCPATILDAVYQVNQKQKISLFEKIHAYFDHDLKGKVIALWGLSFKPDTDDIREAPSLDIIQMLINHGAIIKAFDPICMVQVKELFPCIEMQQDPYHAAIEADAIALLTEWKQFRSVDFERIKRKMKGRAFFDGRNQFNPSILESLGFDHIGIGLGKTKSICDVSLV